MTRKPLTWLLAVLLGGGAAFGLFWFQPWKLFTNQVVAEILPITDAAAPEGSPSAEVDPSGEASPSAEASVAPSPKNVLLASGEFVTHEHETTGTARLIRLSDGSHQLALQDLATSNGPDLRVWLTDQPVLPGRAGWHVFDDGRWLELDRLKGNRGDQVYDIPADANLDDFRSVSIWCKRFSVSFGAAELRKPS
ncbi:DM13 domain-containing protein [Micromonospora sp. NPDC049903]|uniref:DM13 domain-containing protein n=1 Tax=Micromonospora sp. NPDC049903 TaxID=3364276 RepID=UPI0037B5C63C